MNTRIRYPSAEFLLPRGRLVRGSVSELQTKDHEGKPLDPEKYNYWAAIAVPKGSAANNAPGALPIDQIVNAIWQHTRQTYASLPGGQLAVQQIDMGLQAPAFSWKIVDGDTDPKWSTREGCKGCWVIFIKTGKEYPVNCFDAANAQLDPKAFKLGDYVDAFISVEINGKFDKQAGIFINPRGLRYLGEGPRIIVGPDANSMFGAAAGPGYTAPLPSAGAPSHQMMGGMPSDMGQMIPGNAGVPGVAGGGMPTGGAPASMGTTPAPSPASMSPVAAYVPAEIVAQQFGVQHFPGYRFDPATRQYGPDTPPPQQPGMVPQQPGMVPQQPGMVPQQPGMGGPAPLQHAAGMGAPVGVPGIQGAPSGAPGSPMGTAYPSSAPGFGPSNPPPGIQPHPGFVQR